MRYAPWLIGVSIIFCLAYGFTGAADISPTSSGTSSWSVSECVKSHYDMSCTVAKDGSGATHVGTVPIDVAKFSSAVIQFASSGYADVSGTIPGATFAVLVSNQPSSTTATMVPVAMRNITVAGETYVLEADKWGLWHVDFGPGVSRLSVRMGVDEATKSRLAEVDLVLIKQR